MENPHFNDVLLDMKPSDIDNNFFRSVAENHGVEIAADLILIYERLYPDAKEGQRKINVPLKSTFVFRANKRRLDGVSV